MVRRAIHRDPPVHLPAHRQIIQGLEYEGVFACPVSHLRLSSTKAFLSDARRAAAELRDLTPETAPPLEYPGDFTHCIPLNPSHVAREYPALYMWGLDHEILDLVENTIGTRITYHGLIIRKELVDNQMSGTRFWHLDCEDYDTTRISIYLSDVLEPDDGAFEYVPRIKSPSYADFGPGVDLARIDDATLERLVPRWQWQSCLGPAETAIFAVTSRVFHHGRLPRTERIAASYYYTSDRPLNPTLARRFSFRTGMAHLDVELSARQRACLGEYAHALPR